MATSHHLWTVPGGILLLFGLDVALGGVYILNHLVGYPHWRFTQFVDLGDEGNLPTWYASIKWFLAALVLGGFIYVKWASLQFKLWSLCLLPLIFVLFSLDETAGIHEFIGYLSDGLLPGGDRDNTMFHVTGIWMFVLGIPFILIFVAIVLSIRHWFKGARGALTKIVVGVFVALAGALLVEVAANFVAGHPYLEASQVFVEEMLELVGGTIVVWGAYELLSMHDIAIRCGTKKI